MRFIKHESANIFKGFNEHECSRMDHGYFAIFPGKLITPLDKGGIEVSVEFIGLFVVVLYKVFQHRSEIRTVGIRRIGGCHIVLCSENFQKGDGVPCFGCKKSIALFVCIALHGFP